MAKFINPTKYLTTFIIIALIILDLAVLDDILSDKEGANILDVPIITISFIIYIVFIVRFYINKQKNKVLNFKK